jgi:putative DNA primase/helicase
MRPANKRKTADDAIGRWFGILEKLGVDLRYLRNRHGPCPICGGKDRFRFDDIDGRGTWICSRCGAGDGFDLLRKLNGWGFAQTAKEVDRVIGAVAVSPGAERMNPDRKMRALRDAYEASMPVIKGDPVWMYLHRRLGIVNVPNDLRFHPGMLHPHGGTFPVMLACMRYPDGRLASLHRTYLTSDGSKAPVKMPKIFMPGRPLKTSSVRLATVAQAMGISEGIETALAASSRFGRPIWAAGNAILLENWVPPDGVKEILIAADNDASYTGQAAAFSLARRLTGIGYAVKVMIPCEAGTDWADAVLRC